MAYENSVTNRVVQQQEPKIVSEAIFCCWWAFLTSKLIYEKGRSWITLCWGKYSRNLKCFSKHMPAKLKGFLCHPSNPIDLGQNEWRSSKREKPRIASSKLQSIYKKILEWENVFILLNFSNCWYTKLLNLLTVIYAYSLYVCRGSVKHKRK